MLRDAFKICATCRHLQVVASGQEFAGIADTAFIEVECRLLGQRVREDYLMVPLPASPLDLPGAAPVTCPHWAAPDEEQP